MPRPASSRKKAFPIVAASPSMVAAMFNIRPDDLAKAIEQGLPVYRVGARHRLLLDDVATWFRTLPRAYIVGSRATKRTISHDD